MSIQLTHRLNGMCIVDTGDEQLHFDVRQIDAQAAPQADPGLNIEEEEPIRIVLGPRPGPPLPTASLVVTPSVGGDATPVLDLAKVITGGEFDAETTEMLRTSADSLEAGVPLRVDAYLPAGHSIDVSLLTNHVGHLSEAIEHPIAMRLGTSRIAE